MTTEAQLVCVYRRDGSIKWITQLKAYKDAKSRETADRVERADHGQWRADVGLVRQEGADTLRPTDGDVLRKFRLPDKVYTAPIIANNIVYVYTNDAELMARASPGRETGAAASAGSPNASSGVVGVHINDVVGDDRRRVDLVRQTELAHTAPSFGRNVYAFLSEETGHQLAIDHHRAPSRRSAVSDSWRSCIL